MVIQQFKYIKNEKFTFTLSSKLKLVRDNFFVAGIEAFEPAMLTLENRPSGVEGLPTTEMTISIHKKFRLKTFQLDLGFEVEAEQPATGVTKRKPAPCRFSPYIVGGVIFENNGPHSPGRQTLRKVNDCDELVGIFTDVFRKIWPRWIQRTSEVLVHFCRRRWWPFEREWYLLDSPAN